MNYHCLVTMNCVGVGNSRIHFLFLILVFFVSALYLVLALSVEHTVHCPDSQGMVVSYLSSFSYPRTPLIFVHRISFSCGI